MDSNKPIMSEEEIADFVEKLQLDISSITPMRWFYAQVGNRYGVFFNPDANAGMNLKTATKIMECSSKAAAITVVMTQNRAFLESIKQLTKKAAKYGKRIQ